MAQGAATLVLLWMTLMSVSGCATHRAYPGPARSSDEVARLVPERDSRRQVFLETIDGKRVGILEDRAELLAGAHTIEATVVVRFRGRELVSRHTLEFEAVAAHEYRAVGDLGLHGPRITIADVTTRKTVAWAVTPASR